MKIENRSLILALISSALLALALLGCSSQTTTTSNPPQTTTTQAAVVNTTTGPLTTPASASTTPVSITSSPSPAAAVNLNIAAASSLTDAVKALDSLYTASHPNITLTPNFASSGTLQTQIENGAPADVFISAAVAQMNNLQNENLLDNSTRRNLLNNKVVMIVPHDSALGLTAFSDLASDKVKQIAIGDPKSVPAGTYALQAFDELGITAKLQPKEVLGSDVRQVLTYVESGNVDAGIVYSTDALTSTKVKVVAGAPDDINAKVVYPVAVIKATKNSAAAKDYLNFLFSDQAKAVFEKYGFSLALK